MLLQTDLTPNTVTQCAAKKRDSFKTTSSLGVAQWLTSKRALLSELHIFLGKFWSLRSVACAYHLTLWFFFGSSRANMNLYEEKARQSSQMISRCMVVEPQLREKTLIIQPSKINSTTSQSILKQHHFAFNFEEEKKISCLVALLGGYHLWSMAQHSDWQKAQN